MNTQTFLERYIEHCQSALRENEKVLGFLKNHGIYEQYLFENFSLGYSNGSLLELIGENKELRQLCEQIGILQKGKELFRNTLLVPIYDENKAVINIVGFNIHPQSKNRMTILN